MSEAGVARLMSRASVLGQAMGKAQSIRMSQIVAKRTDDDFLRRKTKIICTMGPCSWDVDKIVEMVDAGLSICRLNFSHGCHKDHKQVVENIRAARKLRPNNTIAIMLDTKGPEIRTGLLKDGKPVQLEANKMLKIVTDYEHLGDSNTIACSYAKLAESVTVGGTILMADGSITAEVVSVEEKSVTVVIKNSAMLGEKKNMNLPNVKVDLPVIGEKDKTDILDFGIPHGCHFIAVSFVQCGEDIKYLRRILSNRGRHMKIISKIENVEGLLNFDDILRESDGIMVARGDLGMEIAPEKVFLAQKMMIAKCNVAGKPVVTATQMLESMTKSPRPTRAEAADVANAVLDGTDAVMLSGETAGGLFPTEAVAVMARICLEAEGCIDYRMLYRAMLSAVPTPISTPEAVGRAAVETANSTNASLICALTETGYTAVLVAKYRPKQVILALSASESTIHRLMACRGVVPLLVQSFQGTDHVIRHAMEDAKELGYVRPGDSVVVVHGVKEEIAGHSNLMKVIEVD